MAQENKAGEKHYWAFVSYSSKDRKWGQWLHKRLENYPIPRELQGTEISGGRSLGKNLRPCFRDRDELSGSSELGPAIQKALQNTSYLIVLCSPNSARSAWVNKEIEDFKAMKGSANILALILEGVPNATSNPAIPDERECFPPALRYPEEPLAGDLRKEGDGKERGFLKILAGVAQLDFDRLYRRHERAQRRNRITLATIATAIIVSLAGLATFAFQQKSVAQQQTLIAKEREKEASYERDQARKTLARFYTERALAGDKPYESLSWLVKACGIDPAVYSNPQVASRAAEWIGPWPAPDLCLGTNILENPSDSFSAALTAHSRALGKSAIQTGPRSWDLIDWKSKKLVGSFEFGETMKSIHHREGETFFILLGLSGMEIRSWDDGRSLYRLPNTASQLEIAPIQGGVFFSNYDYKTKSTRLTFVSEENGDFVEHIVADVEGECGRIAGTISDGVPALFVICEKGRDEPRSLLGFVQSGSPAEWKKQELTPPADFSPLYFSDADGLPEDSLLISQANRQTLLFRPANSTFVPLLGEGSILGFARNTGTNDIQPIVAIWAEGGRGCTVSQRSMQTGEDLTFLSGSSLGSPIFCEKGRAIAAWDEEKKELVYRPLNGEAVTFPLNPPPAWPYLAVSEISEVRPNLLLINAWAGNKKVFFLADLTDKNGNVYHFGSAPDSETCLDAVPSDNGFAVTALTHKGRSISYFNRLLTTPDALEKQPTRIWQAPGKIGWLGITGDGMETALVTREESSRQEVALVSPESGNPAWHETTWRGGYELSGSEKVNILPNGGMAISTIEALQQIDPKGNLISDVKSDFSTVIHIGESHALLSQAEGKLTLSAQPDNKPRWSIPFPDRIQQTSQSDPIRILSTDRSIGYGGEPDKFTVTLSFINPSDGNRTTATLPITGEKSEEYSGYGCSYLLLPGQHPRILAILGSGAGVSKGLILEPSGSGLRETLQWQIDTSGLVDACVPFPDGSFITRELVPGEAVARFNHHQKREEEWISHSLPVTASNGTANIFPNPSGKACVILIGETSFLYSLSDHSRIGSDLKLPGEYAMISPSDRVVWAETGEYFYLGDGNSIHEFSASTGLHLRKLEAHSRYNRENENPRVEHFALSPDARWLTSSDSLGKIITSLIRETPPALKTLESQSHHLGGLRINENDDITAWLPPAFPKDR
jgi:MTH538 TIR-like domain (DUF1863)